ncbi:hypothetical protein ACO1O0_007176 [Amphichorda felina]
MKSLTCFQGHPNIISTQYQHQYPLKSPGRRSYPPYPQSCMITVDEFEATGVIHAGKSWSTFGGDLASRLRRLIHAKGRKRETTPEMEGTMFSPRHMMTLGGWTAYISFAVANMAILYVGAALPWDAYIPNSCGDGGNGCTVALKVLSWVSAADLLGLLLLLNYLALWKPDKRRIYLCEVTCAAAAVVAALGAGGIGWNMFQHMLFFVYWSFCGLTIGLTPMERGFS